MKTYFQPIPDDLNPVGRRCVKLLIPDDPQWIRMFWGYLWGLAKWYTYQRDGADSGKQIAAVWRQIWFEAHSAFDLDECDAPPIETFIAEWEEEMSLKCNIRWCGTELQVLDCGEWVPVPICEDGANPVAPGQPEAQPRPASGQSKCFFVELEANSQWFFPFPLQDNDVVTISSMSGGWNDGTVNWYCPTGKYFSLGSCYGGQVYDGGDPATALYHMQLMLAVNGAYFDPLSGPITIPVSTGVQNAVIRANDASLGDNSGSISFEVCVQSGAAVPVSDWSHEFDFTVSQAGWVPEQTTPQDSAVYDAGQGWTENNIVLGDGIFLRSPNMSNTGYITFIMVEADATFEGTNPHMKIYTAAGFVFDAAGDHASPYPIDLTSNTDMWPVFALLFDPYVGSGESWPHHITKVTVSGVGTDPFI